MSCECYKIGGRFIAEDPDCPFHGVEAQSRERNKENSMDQIKDILEQLYKQEIVPEEAFDEINKIIDNC